MLFNFFVCSLILIVVLSLQFMHKSYPLFLAVILLLVDIYFYGFSLRKLAFTIAIGTSFLMSMYYFYAGYFNLKIITSLMRRISVAYVRDLEFVLSKWPGTYDYFLGYTFPNPKGIFPYEPVNLSKFVMSEMFGRIGNMPVPAIGGGYVNFGYIGMLIIAGLIALWILFLVGSFKILHRSAVGFTIWVMMSFNVINFARNEYFGGIDIKFIFIAGCLILTRNLMNFDWLNRSKTDNVL